MIFQSGRFRNNDIILTHEASKFDRTSLVFERESHSNNIMSLQSELVILFNFQGNL